MRRRSRLCSECSILSGSRRSGNRFANCLVRPMNRSTCRNSTKPPSLLRLPPAKLPSIFLLQSPGNSKLNCVQSVLSEVSCWFVCKRFNPNRLSKRLRYFFARMMNFRARSHWPSWSLPRIVLPNRLRAKVRWSSQSWNGPV